MPASPLSRRNWLKTTATALAAGPLLGPGAALAAGPAAPGPTPPLSATDIAAIEAALGKPGAYVAAEATHVTPLPRHDLRITLDGQPIHHAFGFAGEVSVKHTLDGRSAMLMGDTVLLQAEVAPLISAAYANGLEISALHNHFFYEEPRIYYMHVMGMGAPAELARRFAATLRDAGSPLLPARQPPETEEAPTGQALFDLAALDGIVRHRGVVTGPVYRYTMGRPDLRAIVMGTELTPSIGLNSWAALVGHQADARVAGDVAMLEPEVNAVVATLRAHGLGVVALHSHMLFDEPRMVFLHYYGRGPAPQLAAGFRAVLDQLGTQGPGAMPGTPMRH